MTIQTVNALINADGFDMADAHAHVWAKLTVNAEEENFPISDDFELIRENLIDFKKNGGDLVIDSTPYGCGRDGSKLYDFFSDTGVEIVCVTGFHKKDYYLADTSIWKFDHEGATEFFLREITEGLTETLYKDRKIKPGLIKIPFLGTLEGEYKILTDAAITAATRTGIQLMIHTEQGLNVEWFSDYLEDRGVKPQRVVLCHMDKKPDIGLHEKLISKGYYLEYDTFLRPKYNPEKYTYNLIDSMVRNGFGDYIMAGTDISSNKMWENIDSGTGYGGFFTELNQRIKSENDDTDVLSNLIGRNAIRFLSLE